MARKAAAPKAATRAAKSMSDAHKAALAEGRDQGRAVRRYLEALDAHRPKRGRTRTSESVGIRLAAIEEGLAAADPLSRVHLIQQRLDLEAELAGMAGTGVDMEQLEDAFVGAAAGYSARRGITYSAWRECGVSAAVLRRAGISRSQ